MGMVIYAGDPDFVTASLHAKLVQRPQVNWALASECFSNQELLSKPFPLFGEAGHGVGKPLMTFARHKIAGAFNYEAQPF